MRNRLLILITGVCGFLLPAYVMAEEPWGEIKAEPNPCKIARGQRECTSHITWSTRGVEKAKVWVTSKNKKETKEHDFGDGLKCETERCKAPWITADTRYTFQLWEFIGNTRGKLLASVEVTGEK
jgi:hypothetical protein